jgi:hypothetical protein
MNLQKLKVEDLVGPDMFELTTQDQLFESIVTRINRELIDAAEDHEEIYDAQDAHMQIELLVDEDDADDIVENKPFSDEIISSIVKVYERAGWSEVFYEFHEETDSEYTTHEFKFYFKPQTKSMGI